MSSTEFFVFYHDRDRLEAVAKEVQDDARFVFVDLNSLAIPASLRVAELDEFYNRALLSEYLGFLSIEPTAQITGVFTYSIPLKFCAEWATRTGRPDIFLPEITFSKISAGSYDPSKLYAPEFKDPSWRFPDEVAQIHRLFRVGQSRLSRYGPYKGSFIVGRDVFGEFASWFRTVSSYLVEKVDWRSRSGRTSRFSSSAYSGKTEAERDIDRIRHSLGGIMERAVAYYFGQIFADEDKIRLGPHLSS